MSQKHTLLLLQITEKLDTRTYKDFESKEDCLACKNYAVLCELYEDELRARYPGRERFQYGASELLAYVDSLADVVCLVEANSSKDYSPHGKDWVKDQLLKMLRAQAA